MLRRLSRRASCVSGGSTIIHPIRQIAFTVLAHIIPACCLLLAAGCASIAPAPPPTLPPSEPAENFTATTVGFRLDTRERAVRYTLTLLPDEPLADTLYLEAHFENPAAPETPLIKNTKFSPGTSELHIESPPLHGLQMGEVYSIELFLYESPDQTSLIDRHLQYIQSRIETHDDAVREPTD